MELISIIVPIYNVAEYLEKCLNSITSQSYSNLEVLLVNDGSTDASESICLDYVKKDDRIKYFKKENGGLSDARNYGLDRAKGHYVAFVDSDDFIANDFIDCLYKAMIENEADIAMTNYDRVDNQENILQSVCFPTKQNSISGRDMCKKLLEADGNSFVVAWNKLYKRELFQGIRFAKGKLHEDEYIAFRLLYDVSKIAIVHEILYHYLERSSSITTSVMTTIRLNCLIEFQLERMAFYQKQEDEELLRLSRCYFLSFIIQFITKYRKVFVTKSVKNMLYKFYVDVYKMLIKNKKQISLTKRIYYFVAYCHLDSAVFLKRIKEVII